MSNFDSIDHFWEHVENEYPQVTVETESAGDITRGVKAIKCVSMNGFELPFRYSLMDTFPVTLIAPFKITKKWVHVDMPVHTYVEMEDMISDFIQHHR